MMGDFEIVEDTPEMRESDHWFMPTWRDAQDVETKPSNYLNHDGGEHV